MNEGFGEELYYNTMGEALNAAVAKAEKKGYTVDEDDLFDELGTGGVGYEQTRTGHVDLYINGKLQKKMLHISLYRMPSGKYELTSYIN